MPSRTQRPNSLRVVEELRVLGGARRDVGERPRRLELQRRALPLCQELHEARHHPGVDHLGFGGRGVGVWDFGGGV